MTNTQVLNSCALSYTKKTIVRPTRVIGYNKIRNSIEITVELSFKFPV